MKSRFLPLGIALCALASGCGRQSGHSVADSVTGRREEPVELADNSGMAMAMADSVLGEMTLGERVGQCFMPSIYSRDDDATLAQLRSYISDLHVGGVVLLKGNLRSAAKMSALCSEAGVPLFVAMDAEWGLGMRLEDAPDFPRNGRISAEADENLLYDYGREVARESRRVGINMVLGPVIDVAENPHGVIGSRSFGGDPERVAALGVAYARGLESGGVISVAKHFPGHGSPKGDSHRELPVIRRSLHQLDSVDLYPFRSYVDAGLSGVMVGHLAVPAIDPDVLPAAVSPVVIGDLLRGELGFRGLVLTDALNMGGARCHGAADALGAGADIVVSPARTAAEIGSVMKAVEDGKLDEEVISDRCRRILFYKYLSGMTRREVSLDQLKEDVDSGAAEIMKELGVRN